MLNLSVKTIEDYRKNLTVRHIGPQVREQIRKTTDRSDAHRETQFNNPLLIVLLLIPVVELSAVLIIWITNKAVTLAKRFSGD